MPGVIESPFIGGVTCLNASPIYQVVEAQRRMDCLVHHEMQYVRMRLQRSVSQVLWLNDFYGSEAILLDAAASMTAPCLYSMHAHFLDMQRSPPRKRPLLYHIHVCTCNPIHVCTCNNASWPSTPSTRTFPASQSRILVPWVSIMHASAIVHSSAVTTAELMYAAPRHAASC